MGPVTVMEMIRSATTTGEGGPAHPEWRAAGGGAATAGAGLLVVVVLLLLGMLAVPRASAGFGDALGLGALVWLVLGGGRVAVASGTIALTPLVGFALLVLLARTGARRGLPEAPGPRLQGAWLGGYVAAGVAAVLLGLLAPVGPSLLSVVLPLLLVPGLGLAWAHGLPGRVEPAIDRLPTAVRRALVPGLQGAGLAVAAGGVVVLLGVLINLDRVGHIHSALGAGFFGGVVLVLLQLLAVPNVAIWALSFAAGPGFSSAGGAMTTWSGAESGVLPMIPLLAAQPQPGSLPWVVHLLVLVPVLIGAWTAHSGLRRMPRLAATSTKVRVVGASVLVAALAVALLDALAGGSLGGQRLADLGAPALTLMWVLVLELGLGAALVLVRDWWVLRR